MRMGFAFAAACILASGASAEDYGRPAATQTLFAKAPSPVIPASAAVSVDVDLILPPGAAPERVTHRIAYRLKADSRLGLLADPPEVDAPQVAINHKAAIMIRPPVKGDGWLAGVRHDRIFDGDR